MEEIYDQAGAIGFLLASHLKIHTDNKPDEDCEFCKQFIMRDKKVIVDSYRFEIYDLGKLK